MGTSDFHLFVPLKKKMAEKRFAREASMKQAVTSWLETLDSDFFYARLQDLSLRGSKCRGLNFRGDKVGV
jgi:hypothetical protein